MNYPKYLFHLVSFFQLNLRNVILKIYFAPWKMRNNKNPRNNPNYSYGVIDENVPKSGHVAARSDLRTFSVVVH